MRRSYEDKEIKLLWGFAAARCAFPDCLTVCVVEATENDRPATVGDNAHIVASSDTGPRSDPGFPVELREKYENLILLCATHHRQVDQQENTFTVEDLRSWKTNHERHISEALSAAMADVRFVELEMISKTLLSSPLDPTASFSVTPPHLKMRKNGLTEQTTYLFTTGLVNASLVGDFVQSFAATNPTFPEELKSGFLAEYTRLREDGYEGDHLFEGLRQFAAGGSSDFKRQAAGLAVLVYLFEKCEVFEP